MNRGFPEKYAQWGEETPVPVPIASRKRRSLLTLAISRPSERELAALWKLRQGYAEALRAGPEWSYPCAVEHAGNLYVIYTSEKRHSAMSIIPLRALTVQAAMRSAAQPLLPPPKPSLSDFP